MPRRVQGGFRLQARAYALTYPQCDADKQTVLEAILGKWGELVEWAVIARELHQDGHAHLHVGIQFTKKVDTQSVESLDNLTGQHGNYQAMRSKRNWLAYLVKEDTDYLEHGIDVKAFVAKTDKLSTRVANAVQGGMTMQEIRAIDPGFFMMHQKMIEYHLLWCQREVVRSREPQWDPVFTNSEAPATGRIVQWLNENICQERVHKQPQLWIYGQTNMGKTTLLMWLFEVLRCYWMPNDESYYDLWEEGCYDLIILDEFHGQKRLTYLNQLLEGSPLTMPFKGGQRMKIKNIPVIVCSNGSPRDCYSKVDVVWLDPLYARLTVVEVNEFIQVESQ